MAELLNSSKTIVSSTLFSWIFNKITPQIINLIVLTEKTCKKLDQDKVGFGIVESQMTGLNDASLTEDNMFLLMDLILIMSY